MSAREQFVRSLHSLSIHLEAGGIQDTALPGTYAAEATRLTKNGLSVASFACLEHFIRERIAELLTLMTQSPDLPPFEELPEGLQIAATKGVVEALKYRLNLRSGDLDVESIVSSAQIHSKVIASSMTSSYRFSDWAFGWSTSNVGPSTFNEFLSACGAGRLFNEIGPILRLFSYDYSTAGLTERGSFRLSKMANWRHGAAHDATTSIDVEVLRTRVFAYLAIGFAFDLLASFAIENLVKSFGTGRAPAYDIAKLEMFQLRPSGDQFDLQDVAGTSTATVYSLRDCQDRLGLRPVPGVGTVVLRDSRDQIVDWFFY